MGSGARNIIMLHFSNFLKNKIVLPCKHLSALYKKKKKRHSDLVYLWRCLSIEANIWKTWLHECWAFQCDESKSICPGSVSWSSPSPKCHSWGWPSSNKTSDAVLPLTQRAAWEVGKHPELKVEYSSMNQRRFAEESPSSVQDLCACVCSQEAACF